jgi:hypothetical protein
MLFIGSAERALLLIMFEKSTLVPTPQNMDIVKSTRGTSANAWAAVQGRGSQRPLA